jgi:hypothetical protein
MYTITKVITPSTIVYSIFSHTHPGCVEVTSCNHTYYARRWFLIASCYSVPSSLLDILVVFGITESEIQHLFAIAHDLDTYVKQFGTWTLLEQIADE